MTATACVGNDSALAGGPVALDDAWTLLGPAVAMRYRAKRAHVVGCATTVPRKVAMIP